MPTCLQSNDRNGDSLNQVSADADADKPVVSVGSGFALQGDHRRLVACPLARLMVRMISLMTQFNIAQISCEMCANISQSTDLSIYSKD